MEKCLYYLDLIRMVKVIFDFKPVDNLARLQHFHTQFFHGGCNNGERQFIPGSQPTGWLADIIGIIGKPQSV